MPTAREMQHENRAKANSLDFKPFLKKIVALRSEYGLTREQAALGLEMSATNYRHLEEGKHAPQARTLVRIARFYEVGFDDLLGYMLERG